MSGTLNSCAAEYSKDPKIKPEDIRTLMEWVEKEPHMPKVNEYTLIQFYHVCEYSIQQTKHIVDLHYRFKNEAPEFYSGKDFEPPKYNHSYWDLLYSFDLPKLSPTGFRTFYVALRDFDPAKYNFQICSAMQTQCLLVLILEQGICSGYSIIIDFEGYGFTHLASINLLQLKKFAFIAQETAQIKMREIHLLNGPGIIEKVLMLVKPFLKKELLEAIHVHTHVKSLCDYYGKENIPIDMGGSMPQTRDELTKNFKKRFDSLSDDTQIELAKRADTQQSGGKDNISTSYGSFKRIAID